MLMLVLPHSPSPQASKESLRALRVKTGQDTGCLVKTLEVSRSTDVEVPGYRALFQVCSSPHFCEHQKLVQAQFLAFVSFFLFFAFGLHPASAQGLLLAQLLVCGFWGPNRGRLCA